MIALPLFLQMTLEYDALEAGLVARPAVADHVRRGDGRRQEGRHRRARRDHPRRVPAGHPRDRGHHPVRPAGRQRAGHFALPLAVTGCGLGLLVSQLNNYTLAPVQEERVSEAAGVNSAAGSFGLSFGLAMAGGLMLAALSVSFTSMAEDSQVIPPAQQEQIATALEDDAEVMSNTRLERADHRPARGGRGRGPGDQRRRPQPLAAGRAAGPAPRRPARARQRLPDAAAARPEAVVLARRDGPRLTGRESADGLAERQPQHLLVVEPLAGRLEPVRR